MLGPLDSKPFADIQCSPLGLVEKKVQGECRMIHHLSYSRNKSVNDGIPGEESLVQYSSVGGVISHSRTMELVLIIAKRNKTNLLLG